jgi:hypothetical protein
MPATPIQRLSCALRAIPARQRVAVCRFAGVGPATLQRVLAEAQIRPDIYLKLCGALGIDTMTGEAAETKQIGDLDWDLLGLGFRLTRRVRGLRTVRAAAKAIGDGASPATLSRLENGQPISINGVIAICKFIGTKPEHYCAIPGASHVKPLSETSGVVA